MSANKNKSVHEFILRKNRNFLPTEIENTSKYAYLVSRSFDRYASYLCNPARASEKNTTEYVP